MPINAAWHRKHRLPRNAKPAQRLRWHLAHSKACGCRKLVPSMLATLKAQVKGITP
jgi:hypothetical protein